VTLKALVPQGYKGSITKLVEKELTERACWNWALCAGTEANQEAKTSPSTLYERTNPIDVFTDEPRDALEETLTKEDKNLEVLWKAAKGRDATNKDKEAFMKAMAWITADANGLEPVLMPTPYLLCVTVPKKDWYHWQHWALGFIDGQETRYIQTEPGIPINWGFSRVWEANRKGHLTVGIHLKGIHDQHKEVIEVFLSLPRCRVCQRVKPRTTDAGTRWHRCPNGHTFCGACGYERTRSGWFSETRLCDVNSCGGVTALMQDDARALAS
jgi:hypothetical protein